MNCACSYLCELAILICIMAGVSSKGRGEQTSASLPEGVKAIWDVAKAYREATSTRERICLSGLWQWQPAEARSKQPPARSWGYFKIPGSWPGITDYMQKDSQTVFAHPAWKDEKLGGVRAAWYQREITIPGDWAGRRIAIRVEYLNSFATVFVDDRNVGELRFPGGEVDLSAVCKSGATHTLSMLVLALPLKGVTLSYTDSAAAREVKGTVARRGLCGDVFLESVPRGPRIGNVKVETFVRRREVRITVPVNGLAANARYNLRARIKRKGKDAKEFTSPAFQSSDIKDGRISMREKWMPEVLWDIHTPHNLQDLEVSLLDAAGQVLDTGWAERFGFREFWIDGRDFFLNGSRVFLSAVPLDNAEVSASLATYDAARESLERLKSFGINYVYTHNFGCEPGSHLGFTEILKAADDVGMLVGFSQPHFSHYDWQAPDAERNNGYARHAEYYTNAAQNHPSVVMYAISHNATGYNEDMDPDLIDGVHAPRDNWASRNAKLALRAEAIVKRLDPSRIVYHHASGNLGAIHNSNFYPNFAPIQELSDWFEHWATTGVKPAFTCEYGAPFTWDWTMYRGWYKGQREFGSAKVPWEFCLAEWNAQFFGDQAYKISESEKANLRWEAKQFRAGSTWHRWDYPNPVGSNRFDERYPVFAMYLSDNWRAFRTWGVSGISPWEHEHFWKLRSGVDKCRKEFKVDWDHLQRPGFSPDYVDQRYERMDLAYERSDWYATAAAQALIRNNRPLLAYIAGKKEHFTSKDHNFFHGESIEKQIVVINNSRETVTCEAEWSFGLPQPVAGGRRVIVAAGEHARIPVRFVLPGTLAAGSYRIDLAAKFSNGEKQEDQFTIHVLPDSTVRQSDKKIALFDPQGETTALLDKVGIRGHSVGARVDLSSFDILVVGKAALTAGAAAPDIGRVRDGLKVILFEQTPEVLEKRFGFRIAEYGLRRVFPRVPDHPILVGTRPDQLRDWRGEATILPPRLKVELLPRRGPTVQWCGIPVPRVWRCGNRGNVASVLIEKPVRGDFMPIVDGGFSLQYSPLMEYREGVGVVLFCQLDITGRTESDPAAETVARNLLRYVADWKAVSRRKALYAGEPAGKSHLESVGVSVSSYDGGKISLDQVLIVGPGGGRALSNHTTTIADWLKSGGNLLAIGLDQDDVNSLLPSNVTLKKGEHISAYFEPFGRHSSLAGIGSADVHIRSPQDLPLVTSGAEIVGDGVLARKDNVCVVFCQIAPWRFGDSNQLNLRRTYRRASFLLTRLLANMGVAGATPVLDRFHHPVASSNEAPRWLDGFYAEQPQEWDDPYRFFRW